MSTTYIFAIGGTGSRVLRSLTMLLASGCQGTSAQSEIVPIIFDYDLTNGDMVKKTVPLLQQYASIHRNVYNDRDNDKEKFFCHKLTAIREKTAQNMANNLRFNSAPNSEYSATIEGNDIPDTFADFLGYDQMTGDIAPTQYLLDSLYRNTDDTDPATEINMNFFVGFKGCPNIGCLVAEEFTKTPEYQHFTRVFQQGDRVVIIGSVFGGTGASGIPVILQKIRADIGNSANISVLAMGPYFRINNQQYAVVDSKIFIAKFRAAMTAYGSTGNVNNMATRIYYIADNDMQVPFNYCDGGSNQQNPSVFPELAGAMCVMQFIADGNIQRNGVADAFEFGMKGTSPISNVNNPIPDKARTFVVWDDFFETTINNYLKPLRRLALFSGFCKYYVNDNLGNAESWYHSATGIRNEFNVRQLFEDFYKEYKGWLNELRSDHRPLKILNLSGNIGEKDYKELMDGYELEKKIVILGIPKTTWKVTNKAIADKISVEFKEHSVDLSDRPQYLFVTSVSNAINYIDTELDKGIDSNKQQKK